MCRDLLLCKHFAELFVPTYFPVPIMSKAAQLQQLNAGRSVVDAHGSLFFRCMGYNI